MDFEELSDEEWSHLAPVLCMPHAGIVRRGRPRIQPRVLANAILWVLTIGGSWSKLPSRYPSPPTCRCRFEEWRVDGKLEEMVRILGAEGRSFSYAIDSSRPEKDTALERGASSMLENGLPHVLWRSQESWQASHGSVVPYSSESSNVNLQTRADMEAVLPLESLRASAMPEEFAYEKYVRGRHRVFWMGLASASATVIDAKGYVVYIAVDTVHGGMFRGWTEIMCDGKRVARSGLIGPRFCAPEAAMQFALAWARSWIELHAKRARIHDVTNACADYAAAYFDGQ